MSLPGHGWMDGVLAGLLVGGNLLAVPLWRWLLGGLGALVRFLLADLRRSLPSSRRRRLAGNRASLR